MLTSTWSISTLILKSPTAPLKLLGFGSGKALTFILTSSDCIYFVSVSVKKELKNGSKNGSLFLFFFFSQFEFLTFTDGTTCLFDAMGNSALCPRLAT